MGLWDSVKKTYNRIDSSLGGILPGGTAPQPKTTTTTISPEKTAVRSIDVTESGGRSAGGVTIKGPSAWSSGGGSGGGKVSVSGSGNISQQQAEEYAADAGYNVITPEPEQPQPIRPGETGRLGPGNYGGAYYITPAESANYKGTAPVWEVESPNTIGGYSEEIDIESRYSGSVNAYNFSTGGTDSSYGPEISRGQYELNQAQINTAKEYYNIDVGLYRNMQAEVTSNRLEFQNNPESFSNAPGFNKITTETPEGTYTNYSLSADYFANLPSVKLYSSFSERLNKEGYSREVYSASVAQARTDWQGLPADVRQASTFAERRVAVLRVGTEFGYSYLNYQSMIGTQTTTDLSKGFTSQPLKPSGFFADVESTPVMPGGPYGRIKTGVAVGAVAITIFTLSNNISGLGLKGGLKETASYLSPLRIQSGTYVPDITKQFATQGERGLISNNRNAMITEFRGGSYSVQTISGSAGEPGYKTYITGTQNAYTKGSITKGVSYGEVSYPYARYAGGELTFGRQSTPFFNVFQSSSIQSGTSSFNIAKISSLTPGGWIRSEAAGLRTDIPLSNNINYFGATSGPSVTGTIEGTNRNINIFPGIIRAEGLSFNLGTGGGSGGRGFTMFRGGGGTRTITDTGLKTDFIIGSVSKPAQLSQPAALDTAGAAGITGAASFQAPGQTEQEAIRSSINLSFSGMEKTIFAERNTMPSVMVGAVQRGGSRSAGAYFPVVTIMPGLSQDQRAIQTPALRPGLRTGLISPPVNVPVFTGFDYGYTGPPPPTLLFDLNPGDLGLSTNIIKGGRRETGYTPSFSALVFNIRGRRAVSGIETGINFRPITPGFSLKTGLSGFSKTFRRLFK